jgi:hypothetical protein
VQIEQEGAHARLDAGWLRVVDQEKWSPVTRIDEITDDNMAQIPSGTRGQDVVPAENSVLAATVDVAADRGYAARR